MGSTMPKPKRSMKTTKKTINSAERLETAGVGGSSAGAFVTTSGFCISTFRLETNGSPA
jgi:hypothetical protein